MWKYIACLVTLAHEHAHSAEYALTATTVRITVRLLGHVPSLKQCTRYREAVRIVPKIVLSMFRGEVFAPPPLSLGAFNECSQLLQTKMCIR